MPGIFDPSSQAIKEELEKLLEKTDKILDRWNETITIQLSNKPIAKKHENTKYKIISLENAMNGAKLGSGGLQIQGRVKGYKNDIIELKDVINGTKLESGGIINGKYSKNPLEEAYGPPVPEPFIDSKFSFPFKSVFDALEGIDTYIKKYFNQEKTFLSKPLSYIKETKTTINDTVEFIGKTSKGITDVLDSFSTLGTNKFTKTTSWLSKSLTKATPYLQSVGAGAMTGYTLGKNNALLGIGGGMASGAINGAMLAGPWGAGIGAAAGLAGGLFGWLFGGKKRLNYETAKISRSQATAGRYLGGNSYNLSQFKSQVKDDFYLGDFLSTENAIQKKLQEVNLQINQIADDLNPAHYKKLSKEAQEARTNMLKNLQAQQSELEGLLATSQAGYNSRKAHLEETEAAMRNEVATYSATINADPFSFNQPLWELQRNEAFQKYLHDREVYKDSPAIVSLLQQRMLLEDQQLLKSRSLQKITAKQNETDFLYKIESARLTSIDASEIEILQTNMEKSLQDLELEIQNWRQNYANNQAILTQITDYQAYQRVNIEKAAQAEIESLFESSNDTIADLLEARSDALNSSNFQRARTQTAIQQETIDNIDEQLAELIPNFVSSIQSMDSDTLSNLTASQLSGISETLQGISNYSQNNNITVTINGDVEDKTGLIQSIETSLQQVLSDNKGFAPA